MRGSRRKMGNALPQFSEQSVPALKHIRALALSCFSLFQENKNLGGPMVDAE